MINHKINNLIKVEVEMVEVEAGFKILEDKLSAEKILLAHGFVNTYKTHTRDIYFGKDTNFENKDEAQIKRCLVRCRNFEGFENLKLLDRNLPDKIKVDFKTLLQYFDQLFSEGFKVVFDTQKSDWIYKKGNCWHQFQEIKDIGLVDYVYNEEVFGKGLSEDEQFEILKNQMLELGFHLEYDLGIDKLRSLYSHKLMFSKNQIGKYEYQEK